MTDHMMTMTLALLVGAALGLLYFAALWATLSRLPEARQPALLMLGSLLLRFTLAVAGFFVVARYGGWQHLLLAAAGFTALRLVMVRRLQPAMAEKAARK